MAHGSAATKSQPADLLCMDRWKHPPATVSDARFGWLS